MKINPLLLLAATLCFLSPVHAQRTNALTLTQTIALPNVQGGFNHMSVDAEHHRLFVAAPINKTLEIVDLKSGEPWRSLEGEKPAAARYAPEFNQLYVSRGQSVYVYDGQTLNVSTSIDLRSRLDELQYDARAKELYVGCMTPGKTAIAVIAIPEGKLVGKVPLPAAPQGIAVEEGGVRLFANVPNMAQVAVIDRRARVLLPPWPVKRVKGNTPIGLDEAHQRMFLGGREPPRLVVLDSLTGKTVAEVPIDGFADDLFYDPTRQRIYISCGEGFIDVIEQRDADHYRQLARIPTTADAATSTFSAPLNRFYLGVARSGKEPGEIRVFAVGN
ncbi:MAG: hypothetical protein DMG24_08945 [Acidobacteria bacterium]|nr:MAG: hypothetical protein DMG24_08945 [Acidobacteriota bacterium]